jgi:hypothetical protein
MHKDGYLSASPTGLATPIGNVHGPIHELSPTRLESKTSEDDFDISSPRNTSLIFEGQIFFTN